MAKERVNEGAKEMGWRWGDGAEGIQTAVGSYINYTAGSGMEKVALSYLSRGSCLRTELAGKCNG